MKVLSYISLLTLFISLFSCKKDNYDAPSSTLTGALMYNGDSIGVEYDRVAFQVYQYDKGKIGQVGAFSDRGEITQTTFNQEGVYSLLLFNGDYKFTIPNGQGPFLWKQTASGIPDSVSISVNGNQTSNIEVTPYYMIRNPQITGSGANVSSTFSLEKIITDSASAKNIERVNLFINKTQFVSGGNNIANSGLDGSAITDLNNISLTVAIPSITPTQNYVFARIGVKIDGIEDMLFSSVQRIQF